MRIFKNKEDGLKFGLSLFLIVGSILGTMFCNLMSDEMKEALVIRRGIRTVTREAVAELELEALFFRVLIKRMWAFLMLLLASAVPAASLLLMIAAGYIGFSHAAAVCVCTMDMGAKGILCYFVMMMPQGLMYLLCFYLVLRQAAGKQTHWNALAIVALTALMILGVLLESYVNPWLLAM